MGHHGAHNDFVTLKPNSAQLIKIVEINQNFWSSKAQFHHWQQAVPTGQQPGIFTVLFQ